jgi:hypothetical protein
MTECGGSGIVHCCEGEPEDSRRATKEAARFHAKLIFKLPLENFHAGKIRASSCPFSTARLACFPSMAR